MWGRSGCRREGQFARGLAAEAGDGQVVVEQADDGHGRFVLALAGPMQRQMMHALAERVAVCVIVPAVGSRSPADNKNLSGRIDFCYSGKPDADTRRAERVAGMESSVCVFLLAEACIR